MAIRPKELPETTENWAEADFKGHAKSIVTLMRGYTLVMDEPKHLGGSGEGPSPMDYLVTSLAGCTAVILERCAMAAKARDRFSQGEIHHRLQPEGNSGPGGLPIEPERGA